MKKENLIRANEIQKLLRYHKEQEDNISVNLKLLAQQNYNYYKELNPYTEWPTFFQSSGSFKTVVIRPLAIATYFKIELQYHQMQIRTLTFEFERL